jgi:cbb3-type cytochrome oxidase cytochrome c subunit
VAGKPITKGSHLIWYHDIDRARLMAPDLSLAGERLQVSWMSKWLKNPYCVLPTTTMPGLPLTADEVDSLVHYLNSLDHGRIDIRNRQGCLNGSNSH